MKVLLTHCWFISEDPAELRVMKPYPPLGLLSLSAWLTREGIEHEIFDTTFRTPQELIGYIRSAEPLVIGFYSTLMTRLNVLRTLRLIRDGNHSVKPAIIIGGPDARVHAEGYLEYGADAVIPGEGELPLTETIRLFTGDPALSPGDIKGIVFRNQAGEFVHTQAPKLIDPAQLPIPARGKIGMDQYFESWKNRHGYTSMTVNTMRGCPYTCSWCSKPVFGNSYRRRDPPVVADELEKLTEEYHPDQFWFTDDVFTIRTEWLAQFATELESRNLRIRYECISREDCLDADAIHMLARSGCRKLWIGAESGSQRILDLMDRRTDIRRTAEMIGLAREAGISTGTFIMLGYPGETLKDILQTGRYLETAKPDEVTVTMAYPIEGTRFFDNIKSKFLRPYRWDSESERSILYHRKYPSFFYRMAMRWLLYRSGPDATAGAVILHKLKKQFSPLLLSIYRNYTSKPRSYRYKDLRIRVNPGVFHPALFHSTGVLLDYIDRLDLAGKKVLELGAGTGIIAMLAARNGATVTATDINPAAVQNIRENALHNNLGIEVVKSDLFAAIEGRFFDHIVINPPYYPKDPETTADAAWFCGKEFGYFTGLFPQLRTCWHDGITVLMILSQDCDITRIRMIAGRSGFGFHLVHKERRWGEWNYVYRILL